MSYVYNPFTDNLDRIVPASILPPTVATTYPTDINSPAVPVANSLSVLGGYTGVNFNNGIVTDGDNGSGSLYVTLTNRLFGGVGTSGADTTELIQFALDTTPGVYTFTINVCAFEDVTPSGSGYQIVGSVRSTGAAAVLIGTPNIIANEEGALSAADIDMIVSGNDMIIEVTGVAGLNINWTGIGYYVFGE